jgi:C-terminal processing protease CtpA/Prc
MTRTWIVAAVAALTLSPVAAAAQETPRPRPAPRARTRVETGPFRAFSFGDNRGRIGVVVKAEPDAADDKVGARIEAVTPGGPAEKAGLKAGDIITRFNGTALGGAPSEDEDASGPGMKLIDLAHALDPGDTVQVEYRRGNDTRKATIVAEEVSWGGMARTEMPDMPEMSHMLEGFPRMQMGPGAFAFTMGDAWGGIELVKLNPDLGEYFGAREGVLVVRASEDSTLPLKGGDVILAIGGRKPTSPMHAMRILRSYDSGETVSIDVLRKQKRATLTWKVPESEERFNFTPRARRPREEPSGYRIAPKIRLAPAMAKAVRAYRAI